MAAIQQKRLSVQENLSPNRLCICLCFVHRWRPTVVRASFLTGRGGKISRCKFGELSKLTIPFGDKLIQAVAFRQRQVGRLIPIVGQIVKLPRFPSRSDGFPVAHTDCFVTVVKPPQRLVRNRLVFCESGNKAPAWRRWCVFQRAGSGKFQHGRHDIDDMTDVAAEFATCRNTLRPGHQQRR